MNRLRYAVSTLCLATACLSTWMAATASAQLTINYRGKVALSSTTATDQKNPENTFTIQGLSGVTYLDGNNFTAVMDNSKRLVNLNITFNADGSIATANVASGFTLNDSRDYEGIAYTNSGRNSMFLSEEASVPGTPAVYEYSLATTGNLLQTINMPAVFSTQRDNRGLESLTRRADGSEMWTANQAALTADGPEATTSTGTVVRLQRLTVSGNTVTPSQEYAYVTQPDFSNSGNSGLNDMLELPNGTLLTLEKATGSSPAFRTSIFQVGFAGATDVSQGALASGLIGQSYTPVSKTLLFSSTTIGEGVEGLCLGPQLADGNWEVLGVADNNGTGPNTLVAFELVGVVPEPASFILAAVGGSLALVVTARSHRRLNKTARC